MRVLFIAEKLDLPELHLILGLARLGCGAEVLFAPADNAQSGLLDGAGVGVTPLELRGRVDPAAIRLIRRGVASRRFDIVHCLRNNRPVANALLACAGLEARLVAYRGTMGHLSRLDPGSWLTYLNPRLSRIVCVSEAVRQYLLTLGVPPRRLATIHKGHDVAWYQYGAAPDLREFGIPPGAFVAGCAANLRPVKGGEVLVRAFHRLPENPAIHLLLAGEVRDARVARLAEDPAIRSRVHLAGFREDAAALMGACQAVVMPSLKREGMPRAVIEAMAQGVPAIVTRVGGMPELVADGVHGYVVPPGDPEALADAMVRMARDPGSRTAMGQRARERIRTEFSIERFISRTIALYESLLAG